MIKLYKLLIPVLFSVLFYSSAIAQNKGLTFNGTSQHVNCGTTTSTALNANLIRTMECWVKFNNFTGNQEIISRSVTNVGIEILVYNNNLAFFCMNSSTSVSYISYATSNLTAGVWYHIAATWDGTRANMRLYVNGISVGTRTDGTGTSINTSGVVNPSGSTFRIGNWSDVTTRYFNGSIDEVRVWSVNRTAAQIKAGMYGIVDPSTTGLIAYYPFDNVSGIDAPNMTSTPSINGTLVNSPTLFNSPVFHTPNNGLHFDGVNDEATTPGKAIFDLSTGTVEFWIRPTAISATVQQCILGNRGTAAGRYSFHVASNQVGLWNGTSYVTRPYTFANNNWYHVAFVCTSSTSTTIYVNGVSIGSIALGFGTSTTQPIVMGVARTGTGNIEYFAGDIDDVRIWNTQRTATQIKDNQNTIYTGSEANLVALWSFNQGFDGGANAGLTIAIDETANNSHLTLANFGLSSTTSNFRSHPIALPVLLNGFTGNRSGDKAILQWSTAQEFNSQSFVVERSTDAQHFTAIGTVAAAGNSNALINYSFTDVAPKAGSNYYRLKQVDIDGKTDFSKIITVQFPSSEFTGIAPNPARTVLNYTINSQQKTNATAVIYTTAGQKVWSGAIMLQPGKNTLTADIHQLPAGTYTLQIQDGAGAMNSSLRFSVVK